MERLLQSRDTTGEDDFYQLLGCDESSTTEQIATEYKQLARRYHPDKERNEEDKDKAEKYFVRLEQAKNVLLDKDTRFKYDQWRSGGFKHIMSFKNWLQIQSKVHSSMHWANPKQKVQSLPEPETSTVAHGNPRNEDQNMTLDPSEESEKTKSEINVQDDKPSPLQQFRRGSESSFKISQFRNYHF